MSHQTRSERLFTSESHDDLTSAKLFGLILNAVVHVLYVYTEVWETHELCVLQAECVPAGLKQDSELILWWGASVQISVAVVLKL